MDEPCSIRKLVNSFTNAASKNVEMASHQIISFGIIMFINYPLYYLVWHARAPQSYENLILRLFASLLCFALIFHNHWPECIKRYLTLYWYLAVAFCLPFFYTFMTLKNNASTMWLMSCMAALFFLFLLFDVLSASLILMVSVPLAFVVFLSTPHPVFAYVPGTVNLIGIISSFAEAFIIGAIFSHNNEVIQNEKLKTLAAFGGMIAHEMRTPLVSINMTGSNLKRWFSSLLTSYEIASQHKLDIPYIDPRIRNKLVENIASIEVESTQAQQIINMLLTNLEVKKTLGARLSPRYVSHLINEALTHYAFDRSDRNLIEFDSSYDFEFNANDFFINVIFNLLKNSLHQIKAAEKGKIKIWTVGTPKFNELHFKDTAKGISQKKLAYVFKPFASDTRHGTGLGLTFCKMVVESYGGTIRCDTKEGEFAEFILSFPKLPKS